MSRSVLFSFLGTTNYLECVYTIDSEHFQSKLTRFIQTALYEYLSKDIAELDVIVFVTKEAETLNWESRLDRDGNQLTGLKESFAKLLPQAHVEKVMIDSEQTNEASWKLFQTLCAEIKQGDTIYFDITHSFRSNPMVALAVMNYARIIYQTHFGGVMYGWFEQKGPAYKLKEIDKEKRFVPIINISNMMRLFDWTNGVDQFLRTGDSSKLAEVIMVETQEFGRENRQNLHTKLEMRQFSQYKKIMSKLQNVDNAFSTVRNFSPSIKKGPGIPVEESFLMEIERLRDALSDLPEEADNRLRPLILLIDKIRDKFSGFTDDGVMNLYYAAKWCRENQRIQQAYTFLQEGVITAVCALNGVNEKDRNNRQPVNIALNRLQNSKLKDGKDRKEESGREEKQKEEELQNSFVKIVDASLKPYRTIVEENYGNLTEGRNNINHAGMNEKKWPAEKLVENLDKCLSGLEPLFKQISQEIKESNH